MSRFNVVSKYVAAVPRSQRRKGAGVSSAPSSGVAGSGIDKNTLSQFVDLYSPQTVEGLKNFLNGLQIGGKLVKYDAVTNAFVFPANAIFEGGIAWNTKLEGFEEQTITAAVQVDWKTIGKNENGELYVIGGTSGGGGGVVGGVTLDEVKNYLTAEKYTTETWVSAQNYATQSWVTNRGYITGITSSMVASALGYTPFDAANFTKAKVKSTLGISDWALASVKPSYKFSEITNKPTTLSGYGITDAYTKIETDSAIDNRINALVNGAPSAYDTLKEIADVLAGNVDSVGDILTSLGTKANKATTLAGYGIVDAYTKTQVDSVLAKKWTQDDDLIANWNSAYLWGNHALAGYAKQSDVTEEFKKYVTLSTAQTITGVKNFSNGLKVGGALVSYNADKNAFIFPANAIFEGGIAWNSKLDGFSVPTIMDAIKVDGSTISKANGYLEFVGQAGGGVADSVAWGNVTGRPTKLSQFTDDVVSGNYLPINGTAVNSSKLLGVGLANGNGRKGIPTLTETGYMDVGIAMDFHRYDDGVDYSTRLRVANGNFGNTVWLPTSDGTIALTSDITNALASYVTIGTAQNITGIKDFVNGFKIGGTHVTYNASKNAFVFPANAIFEGGVAWNSKIDGFDVPTIMDAVIVDGETIVKENGVLKVNGDVSGGINESQLSDYLTRNNYAKKSDIPSLSGYATEAFVTTRGYITSSAIPTKVSAFTNDSGYITGITSSMVTSALGYTPFNNAGGTINGALTVASTVAASSAIRATEFLRVNTVDSAGSYAYIRAQVGSTSITNRAVAHLGTNYGYGYNFTLTNAYDAIAMYRSVVGVGGTFTYDELYANQSSGIALQVAGHLKVDGANLSIGGKTITYNASKNAFIFPANAIFEGGIAWHSKLDGFDVPTITNAVKIDNTTIKKNSDSGALEVSADVIARIATLEARIEQLHPTA